MYDYVEILGYVVHSYFPNRENDDFKSEFFMHFDEVIDHIRIELQKNRFVCIIPGTFKKIEKIENIVTSKN